MLGMLQDDFSRKSAFSMKVWLMAQTKTGFSRAAIVAKFHCIGRALVKNQYMIIIMQATMWEKVRESLIEVFRRWNLVPECTLSSYPAANRRLAAKWSHLANICSVKVVGKRLFLAAFHRFLLEPHSTQRILKMDWLWRFMAQIDMNESLKLKLSATKL